jgi:hypothetical protein
VLTVAAECLWSSKGLQYLFTMFGSQLNRHFSWVAAEHVCGMPVR